MRRVDIEDVVAESSVKEDIAGRREGYVPDRPPSVVGCSTAVRMARTWPIGAEGGGDWE